MKSKIYNGEVREVGKRTLKLYSWVPSLLQVCSSLRDCVAMHEWPILVISSGARDLAFSATCEEKISRLWLEMTIATQSRCGEEPAPDSIRGRRRGCSSWCKVCILYCPRIPPSLSSRSNFTTSSLGI